MISAEMVLDSISPQGNRLTTMLLRYPKFIHGEFMTHRVFSRNASSSRAVPVSKNIEEVRSDELRAAPVFWGEEQKGMSPGGELSREIPPQRHGSDVISDYEAANRYWRQGALNAANIAESMVNLGVHKSIINRVLEPFLHINVLVTATEWENFFGLRLDKAADPTMRKLAESMWVVFDSGNPMTLKPGEWHTPWVSTEDMAECMKAAEEHYPTPASEIAIRVSVARCARLTYRSFITGKRSTVSEDRELYSKLILSKPIHASPAEHQATPDWLYPQAGGLGKWAMPLQHGNFIGWRQYRKTLEGESRAPLPDGYTWRQ